MFIVNLSEGEKPLALLAVGKKDRYGNRERATKEMSDDGAYQGQHLLAFELGS